MGIPLTYVEGNGPLVEWRFNGTDLLRAYMNGVLIFEKPLILHLPCNKKNYTSLVLEDFIKANNPNDYRLVFVYLDAGCSHPTLYTGNLSHWYVSLIINGSLEAGTPSSQAALIIESNLQVTNNGYIRGYGGRGGDGGDGKPGSSYTVDTTSTDGPLYDSNHRWYVTCGPFPGSRDVRVTGTWAGSSFTIQSRATPCTSQKTSGSSGDCTYYRGSLKVGNGTCDGDTYDYYSIRRKCGGTKTYSGGSGGNGGNGGSGIYYLNSAKPGGGGSPGSDGGHPEQTRGHSGCKGGDGGTWGQSGDTGSGGGNCYSGSGGSGGGNAIKGARFLDSTSILNDGGSPDRVQGKILQ